MDRSIFLQEHLLQQLNEVILEMRTIHERKQLELKRRFDELETQIDGLANPPDPNEKPPHY